MEERIVKGIWIPIEIWKDKNLTWNEKILLLEIDSYTSKDKDCFISNEFISELLGINETNASKTISSLIKKGYVIKTRFDGRKRYVKADLSFATTLPCQEQQPSRARDMEYTDNNSIDNNNSTNTITKEKEYKEKFAEFVSLYKKMGGKVRGVDTEFDDFKRRHRDWRTILPYLSLAVQRETKARQQAIAEHKFFPEPKMLQTYLGKQKAWELYVTIGEDLVYEEYAPICGGALMYNDYYKCYMYTGYWDGHIADGYTDDNRPDGASVTLNNGRGTIVWSKEDRKWMKK